MHPSQRSSTNINLIEELLGDEAQLGISVIDGVSTFPDGSAMAICTNCANRVLELIGRGEIWGYWSEENPGTEAADGQDGHDFAVIDDRFIVDVWLAHYAQLSSRLVFDLSSVNDESKIQRFYGDRKTWKVVQKTLDE